MDAKRLTEIGEDFFNNLPAEIVSRNFKSTTNSMNKPDSNLAFPASPIKRQRSRPFRIPAQRIQATYDLAGIIEHCYPAAHEIRVPFANG